MPPIATRLALLLALGALVAGASPSRGELELHPCELEGFGAPGRCGRLLVPVDRNDPGSSRLELELEVVELPAREPRASPEPVFYLVGGPGRAATSSVRFFADSLQGVQAHHRVVLLDQRGTGADRPIDCELSTAEKLDLLLALAPTPRLAACRAAAPVDPSRLTTRDAALDLEALRVGLGAERVHLVGISYGTRLAQVYAKLYPEHVATLTLRGLAALGDAAPHRVALGAERQMRRIAHRCAADADCSARFPQLEAHLNDLRHGLAPHLAPTRLDGGGALCWTPARLRGLLRQTVYSARGSASVPWLVERLYEGRLPGGLVGPLERSLEGLALEPLLSIFCAEDVPRFTTVPDPDPVRAETQAAFEPICRSWRVAADPAILDPAPIDAPTLVLSGSEDPATPAEAAERAAAYLRRSRFVVTPGLGHFPSWTSCFARLAAAHIDGTDLASLDVACAQEDLTVPFLLESPAARLLRVLGIILAILGTLAVVVALRRRRGRIRRRVESRQAGAGT